MPQLKTSNSKLRTNFLIVGQGLSGTLAHWFLSAQGKRVLCIDHFDPNSSSQVAAGMYNPIVFKRLNKSWEVDSLLPFAKDTYQQLQCKLNVSFMHSIEIIRFFSTMEQYNQWHERIQFPGYQTYLSSSFDEGLFEQPQIKKPIGGGKVMQSGWVNLPLFLKGYRAHLKTEGLLLEEPFDHKQLDPQAGTYKELSFEHLVFCEGPKVKDNPYFNHLPSKQTKGELLTVEIKNFPPKHILNKGFFMIPLGDNLYRVGATFAWDDFTTKPTSKAYDWIIKKLESIVNVPYNIIDHKAGIRPTVTDRRPLVGTHPSYCNLHILNGMGTKGVLIAPFFANELANHILNGSALNTEVDCRRFLKK